MRLATCFKVLLGAGLSIACAGILGIEDAQCSSTFAGCPGHHTSHTAQPDAASDASSGDSGNGSADIDGGGTTVDSGNPNTEADAQSGNDGGDATAAPDAAPVDPCDQYCTTMMGNCQGSNAQYTSYAFCMNVCPHYAVGHPGDMQGNTLYCRLQRAENAATSETADNCQVAGPSGTAGGVAVCGNTCDNFCDLALNTCVGSNSQYATRAACMQDCQSLPDFGSYNSSFQSGLDVQCRLYHVSAAAGDAVFHCPHVGGAGPCSVPR
ncbi:MAG TPA: hypothetical protein VL137_00245 [Polyangiaceae bacterium]|nr:hypothetical protein [Polyangiaceae bacterium]